MEEIIIGAVEMKFAEIIWAHEPISSGELVKICLRELSWKKSTTYTVLKKLCDKGLFVNTDGTVSSLISKEDFNFKKSEKVIAESFNGSLPAFVAAFIKKKKLSEAEVLEIQNMIDTYKEK